MKRGFTLIEMLVVIGIIGVLIAASLAGFSKMTKLAEQTRARDLVQQVVAALTTMYEKSGGQWPVRMAMVGEKGGELDELVSYAFVSGDTKYLSLSHSGGKLTGYDRFGVLGPKGLAVMKRMGTTAKLEDVRKHRLWFAVDADGDGIIKYGGMEIRATAIVWGEGIRSWTEGQARK